GFAKIVDNVAEMVEKAGNVGSIVFVEVSEHLVGDEILGFGPGDATGVAHAVENDLASLGDGGFLARASRTVDLGEAEDWLDKDGGIGAAGRKGFELDDALELLVGDALAEAGRIGRWSGLTEDGLARGCGLDRGRVGRAFRGR